MTNRKAITVYTLLISHRHGEDVSVFASGAERDGALLAYVQAWWDSELNLPMPLASPNEIIAAYFEAAEGEYYAADDCKLILGGKP